MSTELTLEQIINFLLDAPMFGDLNAAELSQVVHIMQVKRLRPDHLVFSEGDPGDAWYILYEGEVEVVKGFRSFASSAANADPVGKVIAVIGPGGCFGEMAILDGSPRSASVRPRVESTAFRFPRASFGELLRQGNLAAYKLVHQMALVLAARQRSTTTRLVELMEETGEGAVEEGLAPIVEESSVRE
jgi:CRP-like cAMP-binding protein